MAVTRLADRAGELVATHPAVLAGGLPPTRALHAPPQSTKKLGGTERAANSRSCHEGGLGGERA